MTQPSAIDRLLSRQGGEESPLKALYSDDLLEKVSEVPPGLILHLSRAYLVADIAKSKELKAFCDQVLRLMISKDRKGRIEYLEGIVNRARASEEE